MNRLVITPQEAADALATSPNNIYSLLENGTIPATRIFGNHWKIPIDDFKKWLSDTANTEAYRRRFGLHID